MCHILACIVLVIHCNAVLGRGDIYHNFSWGGGGAQLVIMETQLRCHKRKVESSMVLQTPGRDTMQHMRWWYWRSTDVERRREKFWYYHEIELCHTQDTAAKLSHRWYTA